MAQANKLVENVTGYSNFYLQNEIEDAYKSHLNLARFITVEPELTDADGFDVTINRYKTTGAAEKLKVGQGNSKSIGVSFTPIKYKVALVQTKFAWNDEQKMTDPLVVPIGMKTVGADLFNGQNGDIYAEMNKASRVVVTNSLSFDDFVDAQSLMESEAERLEGTSTNAFVHPMDVAAIRKALKDTLQYVKEFATDSSYVGTVAGTNLYKKKDAIKGRILVNTKKAVHLYPKAGIGTDQKRDGDTRYNEVIARKYYVAALRFDNEASIIFHGTAKKSEDMSKQEEKQYYKFDENTGFYEEVTETSNPQSDGLYELVPAKAVAAAAASVQAETMSLEEPAKSTKK